ncbi:hypothetical protein TVAG_112210 [Trichomonas vaginalis G3]|uniref:Uncharacterized protein n=1 Tax=Trichomonas vaginalis (strain ATCC PRA-98 / G3) TaxID=412133 RepID=A2G4D9_TRIV3|nr:exportin 4,7-related family [Trichomonas vaginalis G3]EAX87978.1 hypothetical protein TVAG_112210 [Trichomonas vaginalis G3]KAI5483933.1 exportin 4,7-related family [Trichomonas vaginalis G3]|eukprot:XP_001300908.1 hypothetical protein [Trichomonas vaginalis G3]
MLEVSIKYIDQPLHPVLLDCLNLFKDCLTFHKDSNETEKLYTYYPLVWYQNFEKFKIIEKLFDIVFNSSSDAVLLSLTILRLIISHPSKEILKEKLRYLVTSFTLGLNQYFSRDINRECYFHLSRIISKFGKIIPLQQFISLNFAKTFFDNVLEFTKISLLSIDFNKDASLDICRNLLQFWGSISISATKIQKATMFNNYFDQIYTNYSQILFSKFYSDQNACNTWILEPELTTEDFAPLFLILQANPARFTSFDQRFKTFLTNIRDRVNVEYSFIALAINILIISSRFNVKYTDDYLFLSPKHDKQCNQFKHSLIKYVLSTINIIQPVLPQIRKSYEIFGSYIVSSILHFIRSAKQDIAKLQPEFQSIIVEFLINLLKIYQENGVVVQLTISIIVELSDIINSPKLFDICNSNVQIPVDKRIDLETRCEIIYLLHKTYSKNIKTQKKLNQHLLFFEKRFDQLINMNWSERDSTLSFLYCIKGLFDGCQNFDTFCKVFEWILINYYDLMINLLNTYSDDDEIFEIVLKLFKYFTFCFEKRIVMNPTSYEFLTLMNGFAKISKILALKAETKFLSFRFIYTYIIAHKFNFSLTHYFEDQTFAEIIDLFFIILDKIKIDELDQEIVMDIFAILDLFQDLHQDLLYPFKIRFNIVISFLKKALDEISGPVRVINAILSYLGSVSHKASNEQLDLVFNKLKPLFIITYDKFIRNRAYSASYFADFFFYFSMNNLEYVISMFEAHLRPYHDDAFNIEGIYNGFAENLRNLHEKMDEIFKNQGPYFIQTPPNIATELIDLKEKIRRTPFTNSTIEALLAALNDENTMNNNETT